MATIAVAPFVLKDVLFTVETDNYEAHVSAVTFTPANSAQEWRGLTPTAVFTDPGSETWTVTMEIAQDWETPDSLARYLYQNAGSTVEVTFKPKSGSGPTFEANVTLVSPAIGGTGNAYATASVACGVQGRPVLVDPSPAPAAWVTATVYDVGDRVGIDGGTVVLRALTDGTSDATEPAAPGRSNVVIDGSVAWLQVS
ncbi:hypothetical protein [Jiangella sp. DSM 45060]|uniref:hypothetical protein n=1 Tax=Jiangella sp. DSM 45060 TaxID=1798224 RepID=UPI00087D88CC|nr:hypothetical protein [Jiangella sp. DSM 45060]SDT69465.1 hypothetical protein SAMN04515669_6025 [Jiangella sp. DSM 45060]